jgi:hypothetical protein
VDDDVAALVRPFEPAMDRLMADAADRRDGDCTAVDVDHEAALWRAA